MLFVSARWRSVGAVVPGFLFSLLVLRGCSGTPEDVEHTAAENDLALAKVANGLEAPLYVTAPPSDSRLFIVEQPGRIRIVQNGQLLPHPFLDLTDRVRYGGERGLLSLAFHPNYASNGYLYVNYTDQNDDTHVERYSVTKDLNIADPNSIKLILKVEQPWANHNGGHIQFGPDGMLYIGMGDGGSGGDPHGNAQDRNTLLGDLLRIDVDHGDPYAIPKDNPFVGKPNMRGEIWAWGLRNPWRFAFDWETGLLYIADVGQNKWEEINIVPAKEAGLNYGWNIMEGNHCYKSEFCSKTGLVIPVLEYGHRDGCSITGGYVYRGQEISSILGHYFYADYCLGWIRSFKYLNGKAVEQQSWELGVAGNVMSFGEDAFRNLYICYSNGDVYRLVSKEQTGR